MRPSERVRVWSNCAVSTVVDEEFRDSVGTTLFKLDAESVDEFLAEADEKMPSVADIKRRYPTDMLLSMLEGIV